MSEIINDRLGLYDAKHFKCTHNLSDIRRHTGALSKTFNNNNMMMTSGFKGLNCKSFTDLLCIYLYYIMQILCICDSVPPIPQPQLCHHNNCTAANAGLIQGAPLRVCLSCGHGTQHHGPDEHMGQSE